MRVDTGKQCPRPTERKMLVDGSAPNPLKNQSSALWLWYQNVTNSIIETLLNYNDSYARMQ